MRQRLILKGALEEKKMERMRLAATAQGLITAVKEILQPAAVIPLRELRSAEALELVNELHRVRRKFLALVPEIHEIERELGCDDLQDDF